MKRTVKFRLFDNYVLIKKGYMKVPRWGEGTQVNTYSVRIAQTSGPLHHDFAFYDSIHNTYNDTNQTREELVYSILCCVSADYWTDLEESAQMFFDDDLTVTEARDVLTEVIEHTQELRRLFTDEQIEQLSENDDQLDILVKGLKFVEVKE